MTDSELGLSSQQESEELKQLLESNLDKILSGFKDVLVECGLTNYEVAEFSLAIENKDSQEFVEEKPLEDSSTLSSSFSMPKKRVIVPCPPWAACLG